MGIKRTASIAVYLPSAVANGATFTVPYPEGISAINFEFDNTAEVVINQATKSLPASFGASAITVTNNTGSTIQPTAINRLSIGYVERTSDASKSDGGIADSNGRIVITPPGHTSAAIQAAIDAAFEAGGGKVQLEATTYICTSTIIPRSGVTVEGAYGVTSIRSNVPEDTEYFSAGTILDGVNKSFYGIAANAEDQASATSIIPESGSTGARTNVNHFAENALQNFGLFNVVLRRFKQGIKIGAVNNYGMLRCKMDNVYAEDCAEWGINLTNFQMSDFGNLNAKLLATDTSGAGCIRLATAAPSAVLIPGDSTFQNLFAVVHNKLNRAIVFEVDGTSANALHNVHVFRMQSNRLEADPVNTSSVYNTISSPAGTSIAVANCELFPVDMPVWFTSNTGTDFTYGNGLNGQGAKQMYFIGSRSAASGAGNVTLVNRKGGAAVVLTAGGTYRMNMGGFPGIEALTVVGSNLLHCHFFGVAAEGQTNPAISLQGFDGSSIRIIDVQGVTTCGLVLRKAGSSIVESTTASGVLSTDFDSNAAGVLFLGARKAGAIVGPSGIGIWNGRLHFAADFTVAAGVAGTASTRTGNNSTGGGQVQVVASGVVAAGVVATVTLPTIYEQYTSYYPVISPANAAANALSGANKIRLQATGRTNGFDLVSDAALADGTYLFNIKW